MFEDQQELVEKLLASNADFKELHDQHQALKKTIWESETGVTPKDDYSIDRMKKEKLQLKDKMAALLQEAK